MCLCAHPTLHMFSAANCSDIFNQHSHNYLDLCLSFQSGHFSEDMIPTVGFNMRKVTKGNVTIKVF